MAATKITRRTFSIGLFVVAFVQLLEAVAFIERATSNPDKGTCTRVIPDILLSQEKGSLGSQNKTHIPLDYHIWEAACRIRCILYRLYNPTAFFLTARF